MQGLGRGLGTDVRLTELLAPYINEMLAGRFDPTSSTANTTSAAGPGATCAAVNHFTRVPRSFWHAWARQGATRGRQGPWLRYRVGYALPLALVRAASAIC